MSFNDVKQLASTGSPGGRYYGSQRCPDLNVSMSGQTRDSLALQDTPTKHVADDRHNTSHRTDGYRVEKSGGEMKKYGGGVTKSEPGRDRVYRLPNGRTVKKNRSNQERKNRKANLKKRDEALLEATAILRENPHDRNALDVFNNQKDTPQYWNQTIVKGVGAVRLDHRQSRVLDHYPKGVLGFDR